jgi:hypothetical protein
VASVDQRWDPVAQEELKAALDGGVRDVSRRVDAEPLALGAEHPHSAGAPGGHAAKHQRDVEDTGGVNEGERAGASGGSELSSRPSKETHSRPG